MTTDFNGASTAELAHLARWQFTNVHKRHCADGYLYHCKLNGQLMRVTEARQRIIAQLNLNDAAVS